MFSIDNKPRWKNYSKLRGMLHFWVDSESKHFGYCNCLGHAPHAEKNTFCSSHWYLEDKKGWGGLQLHDYDELSMNYCNCMILYEQFVDHSDHEPFTMFSRLLHAFLGDSHQRYESWWSGHTWNGLYSTVVCCCLLLFAQTAQSCRQRIFAPQQVETIQNEIGKTGKKSLTQLSHPSPEWNSGTWTVQTFSAMLRPHLS